MFESLVQKRGAPALALLALTLPALEAAETPAGAKAASPPAAGAAPNPAAKETEKRHGRLPLAVGDSSGQSLSPTPIRHEDGAEAYQAFWRRPDVGVVVAGITAVPESSDARVVEYTLIDNKTAAPLGEPVYYLDRGVLDPRARNRALQSALRRLEDPSAQKAIYIAGTAAEVPGWSLSPEDRPQSHRLLEAASKRGFALAFLGQSGGEYLFRFYDAAPRFVGGRLRVPADEFHSAAGDRVFARWLRAGLRSVLRLTPRPLEQIRLEFLPGTSEAFRETIRHELSRFPEPILQELAGFTVRGQREMLQQRPDLKARQAGKTAPVRWEEVLGLCEAEKKCLTVNDRAAGEDGRVCVSTALGIADDTLAHEVGHALNRMLGRFLAEACWDCERGDHRQKLRYAELWHIGACETDAFREVYIRERNRALTGCDALRAEIRAALDPYLQTRGGSLIEARLETSATAFEVLWLGPESRHYELFHSYFPEILRAERDLIARRYGDIFPAHPSLAEVRAARRAERVEARPGRGAADGMTAEHLGPGTRWQNVNRDPFMRGRTLGDAMRMR